MSTRAIECFVRGVALATLVVAGCTDEYEERYGCPEDGDCFFSAPQWEVIESLTCLDCPPDRPAGMLPPEPTNPWADDEAARALGERLFNDSTLSPHGVSCADCHLPQRFFTSSHVRRPKSPGDEFRCITSAVDAAYYPWHMWHGGKDSLWSLALGPLEKDSLMDGNRVSIAHRMRHCAPYEEEFTIVFPDTPALGEFAGAEPPARRRCAPTASFPKIEDLDTEQAAAVNQTFQYVGFALEAYMRTLVSGPTPFDAYVRGEADLDASAKRGLALFIGDAHCIACHKGPRFTDDDFHNIGLSIAPETSDRASAIEAFQMGAAFAKDDYADLDRFDLSLVGAMRTPTLRNVSKTGPYMHTSEFKTLEEVIWHYEAAPEPPEGDLDHSMWPLDLTDADVSYLVAFLETLDSTSCPWTSDGTCPGGN